MTFSAALDKAIQDEKISISELYKKTGLARSMIYSIIDNKRRLTPKNNGKLISPYCFPESVVPGLFRSYLESELSGEELAAWDTLLAGLRGEWADRVKKHPDFTFSPCDFEEQQVFYGAKEVLGAIGGAIERGTGSVLSNFPFDGEVPALIYQAYQRKKIKTVRHMICLDGLSPAQKLQALFMAVPFAEAGINTRLENRRGGAYDSFLLTDDYFIEYMDDLSQATVLPARMAPLAVQARFSGAEQLSFRFCSVADSVLGNENAPFNSGLASWFGYVTSFPLVFAKKEFVQASLSALLSGTTDALTMSNGLEKHFEIAAVGDVKWRSLMTDDDLDDFFQNGTVREAPRELFPHGATPEVRIGLAEPFLHTPGYDLSIVRSKYFGALKQFFTANAAGVTLLGVFGGDGNAPGAFTDIRVILNDANLSRLCEKLTDYFVHSYYCMPKEFGDVWLSQRLEVLKSRLS